jgi:FKBP-type peptidyl-prolyl cis-trans isomerase FkpA
MKSCFRALRPLACSLALPLVATPHAAIGATNPAPKSPVTPPQPVAANNEPIPLPLNPIVPAAQRLCAEQTASGLGYTMLRPASGPKPAGDDTVLINYIGYLASNGTVFDQAMRTPLSVGEAIPGFSEGMQLIARSGVIRLCVPPAMGYGEQAAGPIPANSVLVFQVELLDFKTPAELAEMRRAQAPEEAPPEGQ